MTFEQARQIVYSHFLGLSTSLYSSDDVYFLNQKMPDLTTLPKKVFVLAEVSVVNSTQMAMTGSTSRLARFECQFLPTIFVPKGAGSKQFSEFFDLIVANYGQVTVSGLVFKTPRPAYSPMDGVSWVKQMIIAPFYFDSNT